MQDKQPTEAQPQAYIDRGYRFRQSSRVYTTLREREAKQYPLTK